MYSPAARALGWERLLQRRLNVRIDREDQLAMEEAQAAENVRRERHDANLVPVFDRGVGISPFPPIQIGTRGWSGLGKLGAFSSRKCLP